MKTLNSMQLTKMSTKEEGVQQAPSLVASKSAAESAGEQPSLTITKRPKSPTNAALKLVSAKNRKKRPKLRRNGWLKKTKSGNLSIGQTNVTSRRHKPRAIKRQLKPQRLPKKLQTRRMTIEKDNQQSPTAFSGIKFSIND